MLMATILPLTGLFIIIFVVYHTFKLCKGMQPYRYIKCILKLCINRKQYKNRVAHLSKHYSFYQLDFIFAQKMFYEFT
jgi:hypothetical protein